METIKAAAGLLPVFLFLGTLVLMDSYKLIRFRAVLQAIAWGAVAAGAAFFANHAVQEWLGLKAAVYSRTGAPFVEELFKAVYLAALIRKRRLGFAVDGAIAGFAVGAGFAVVENAYYLYRLPDSPMFLWILRGFGTAVMHGGASALFGIVAVTVSEKRSAGSLSAPALGFGTAASVHALFNCFLLPPILTTLGMLVFFPLAVMVVFERSQRSLQKWLGVGFDANVSLLEMVVSGNIRSTRIGEYLQSLKARFPGETRADMLCFLRLYLELSVHAKGILLMREAGFRPSPDPEIKDTLAELTYLEKSIGKTGRLALAPLLRNTGRDVWQLSMLGEKR